MKSIREIGNLSLNRINLLGMLQRAFNSRGKKKKNSPLPCFIPVEKALPWLWEGDGEGGGRGMVDEGGPRLKAHLLFTLYLHEIVYHLFMLFSIFSIPVPYCSVFFPLLSLSDSVSVAARLDRHRWSLPRRTLRTVSLGFMCVCALWVCAVCLYGVDSDELPGCFARSSSFSSQVWVRHGLNIGDSIKTGDYISLLFIDQKYKFGGVQKCNAGVGKKKSVRRSVQGQLRWIRGITFCLELWSWWAQTWRGGEIIASHQKQEPSCFVIMCQNIS